MVGRILGGLEGGKEYDQNMLYKMINKKNYQKRIYNYEGSFSTPRDHPPSEDLDQLSHP